MTDDAEYRARVLQVQYRNIEGNHLSNFRRGYSSGRMAAKPCLSRAHLSLRKGIPRQLKRPRPGRPLSAYACSQDTGDLAAHSRECG
jgi:hypothetical protein